MDRAAFIVAFDQATAFCRDFTQRFVIEELPTAVRFDFASYNRTPNDKGLIKYLGGRLVTPEQLRGVEPTQARKYLWVDGKIPQWINLAVHARPTTTLRSSKFMLVNVSPLMIGSCFTTQRTDQGRHFTFWALRCRQVGSRRRRAVNSASAGDRQNEDAGA